MKHTFKTLLKSGVCLMLVFCMLLGFAPATALTAQAAGEKQNALIYVSIGDSMTNGYCLEGYDGESGAVNYAKASYANQFAAHLAGYTGTIQDDQVIFTGSNGTVDHRQLATSGMRAEDVHWVLTLDYQDEELIKDLYDFDYNKLSGNGWNSNTWYKTLGFKAGDRRTWADLVDSDYRYADAAAKILQVYNSGENGKYFQSSYAGSDEISKAKAGLSNDTYYPVGSQVNEIGGYKYLQISTEFFQKSMADADIISLAVGNTNFGTFMLSEIMDVVMDPNDDTFRNRFKIEEAMALADDFAEAKVGAMKNTDAYKKLMASCVGLANGDATKEAKIEIIVEYCVTSYMIGYIGMVNRILELNPDAQIIIMGLMNAYEEQNGEVKKDTLGELVEIIYTPMNDFLEALPTELMASKSAEDQAKYENAKFYYAEAPHVSCMVDVFGDDFYTKNNKTVTYPGLLNGTEGYTANLSSIVRARFVEEIVCGDMIFAALGMDKEYSQDTVKNFMKGAAAYDMMTPVQKALAAISDANAAKEYALYLAFENAMIRSGTQNITLHSLATLSDIGGVFENAYPGIQAAIGAASVNYVGYAYTALAGVVEQSVEQQVNAAGYPIDFTVTADEIKNLVNAADDDARTAAAKVIAENAAKEIFIPTAVNTAAEGIETVFEGIVDGVKEMLGVTASLTAVDYYNFLHESNLTELDFNAKKQLLADWAADGYNDQLVYTAEYTNLESYINKAYGMTIGSMVLQKALSDQESESAQGFALIAKYGLMLQRDAMIRQAINAHETLGPVVAQIAAGISGNGSLTADNANQIAYLLALPKTMSDAMYDNTDLRGALAMNARILLGTGAGGHPSVGGHNALYSSLVKAFPEIPVLTIAGDVNGDGKITSKDLSDLRQYLANYDYDTDTSSVQVSNGADFNGDGKIDSNDLNALRQYFANYDYED